MVKRPVFLHKENDMLDVLERSSHGGGGRSHQRKGESRLAHLGRMKIQGGNLKKVKEYPDDEGATKQLERGKQLLHKSKASARPTGNKLTKYLATGIEFGSSQLPLPLLPSHLVSSPRGANLHLQTRISQTHYSRKRRTGPTRQRALQLTNGSIKFAVKVHAPPKSTTPKGKSAQRFYISCRVTHQLALRDPARLISPS
jgi:hypothetical protein